jgi:hypothetical protein
MELHNQTIDRGDLSAEHYRLLKLGIHNMKNPPMQAQVQSFQYAACLNSKVLKRVEALEDTIQSQHD